MLSSSYFLAVPRRGCTCNTPKTRYEKLNGKIKKEAGKAMLILKEMIDTARTYGIMATSDMHNPNDPYHVKKATITKRLENFINKGVRMSSTQREKHFYDLCEQAKVFIFEQPKDAVNFRDTNFDEQNILVDLPFKCCWFEMNEGPLATTRKDIDVPETESFFVRGLLIEEVIPGEYNFYWYIKEAKETGHFGYDNKVIFVKAGDPDDKDMRYFTLATIQHLLKSFKNDNIGSINVNEKVKIGTANERRHHKIKNVIYVSASKKYRKLHHGSHPIDWSHRTLVRGHWKRLLGSNGEIDFTRIGKDRNGVHCMKGWAWWTEHERGPDNVPLIANKIRVVRNQSDQPAL